jgi:hypothetical protein
VYQWAAFDESQYEIYTSKVIPQPEFNTDSSSSTNNLDILTFEQRTLLNHITYLEYQVSRNSPLSDYDNL